MNSVDASWAAFSEIVLATQMCQLCETLREQELLCRRLAPHREMSRHSERASIRTQGDPRTLHLDLMVTVCLHVDKGWQAAWYLALYRSSEPYKTLARDTDLQLGPDLHEVTQAQAVIEASLARHIDKQAIALAINDFLVP